MTTDEKLDKLIEEVKLLNRFAIKLDQHLEAHKEGFEPMMALLRRIVSILETQSSTNNGK